RRAAGQYHRGSVPCRAIKHDDTRTCAQVFTGVPPSKMWPRHKCLANQHLTAVVAVRVATIPDMERSYLGATLFHSVGCGKSAGAAQARHQAKGGHSWQRQGVSSAQRPTYAAGTPWR